MRGASPTIPSYHLQYLSQRVARPPLRPSGLQQKTGTGPQPVATVAASTRAKTKTYFYRSPPSPSLVWSQGKTHVNVNVHVNDAARGGANSASGYLARWARGPPRAATSPTETTPTLTSTTSSVLRTQRHQRRHLPGLIQPTTNHSHPLRIAPPAFTPRTLCTQVCSRRHTNRTRHLKVLSLRTDTLGLGGPGFLLSINTEVMGSRVVQEVLGWGL